jgi:hypothetical protein
MAPLDSRETLPLNKMLVTTLPIIVISAFGMVFEVSEPGSEVQSMIRTQGQIYFECTWIRMQNSVIDITKLEHSTLSSHSVRLTVELLYLQGATR